MNHPKRAITRDIRTRRPKRPGQEVVELETTTRPEGAIRVGEVMMRPALTIRELGGLPPLRHSTRLRNRRG